MYARESYIRIDPNVFSIGKLLFYLIQTKNRINSVKYLKKAVRIIRESDMRGSDM